ncbi:uncharacterized protein [Struthio camelus]|uniref:uncharacterized protein isoform X1 n=1 Tax=Struthio camelus TaxID=8801 RepID=UPI003603C761
MLDQIHLLAAVTVLGVLEQAYFFLQVIYARRTFGISPPKISGPPEFERIFRAQSGCILGSALSLLSLLLLYGLQGIVVRKVSSPSSPAPPDLTVADWLHLVLPIVTNAPCRSFKHLLPCCPALARSPEMLGRYSSPTALSVPSAACPGNT